MELSPKSKTTAEYFEELFARQEKETKNRWTILLWSLILFGIVILIGIVGFRYFFELNTLDAFYSSALVISSLSLSLGTDNPKTKGQKIFTALYALVAVTIFIGLSIALVGGVVARFLN